MDNGNGPFRDQLDTPMAGGRSKTDQRIFALRKIADGASTHGAVTNRDAAAGPYDLSDATKRTLVFNFSLDNGTTWGSVTFTNLVGATPAATTAAELTAILNAKQNFADLFTASDAAGTLRIVGDFTGVRFKMYFTGSACSQLAGTFTAAIAVGSAVASGTAVGVLLDVIAEDMNGNPVATALVTLSADRATAKLGLAVKGTPSGPFAQAISGYTDIDGRFSVYVVDSVAETITITAAPGPNVTNAWALTHSITLSSVAA